jgi:hypothetical protein
MNTERLLQLADYLEALPANYSEFEMAEFWTGDAERVAWLIEQGKATAPACGTAACAMGHIPFVGYKDFNLEDYIEVTSMFGLVVHWFKISVEFLGLDVDEDRWDWMFAGEWSSVDNSPQGAAQRIRMIVDPRGMEWTLKVPDDEHPKQVAEYWKTMQEWRERA